ncbi:MAG: carbamoyltransferase HypF [Lachnospiraceae bacterium]|nr:carbamoyltransferase HypF [Lachnospiraceae bacterium]
MVSCNEGDDVILARETRQLKIYGIVQGVGFRPTVARFAEMHGVCGSVCNYGPYVEIIATGESSSINALKKLLRDSPPDRADIQRIDDISLAYREYDGFEIVESRGTSGEIFIPADIATCEDCRRELFDKNNRRYLHPFINCTQCGPRFTILENLPYDRERTTMKDFPMCDECSGEYHDSTDRRYDAQPVCCPDCGPEVYIVGSDIESRDAITYARKALADGKIVAIKGIGGFHLACDATNEAAVKLLRERKNRPRKPFAVMMKSIEAAEAECEIMPEQRYMLCGHQKPIVLLKRKSDTALACSVAPGNTRLGVMLPYTPLHMLLFDYPDDVNMPPALVMTSGNVSGAPICHTDDEAVKEIGSFVDLILSHNRPIRTRADDTVMDFYRGRPYMIRRSRGFAPLPFKLGRAESGNTLAVGGELKNTFCYRRGNMAYPSAFIGDLADIRSVEALKGSIDLVGKMLEIEKPEVVCDLHPGYHSTEVAEMLAQNYGVEPVRIQHHYAHILSCMAENAFDGEVLGASFDGTGYGTDGTIWGGEILRCSYSSFERLGSIVPFKQVGGDSASKSGWRIAASMIASVYGSDRAAEIAEQVGLCRASDVKLIAKMAEKGLNTAVSTSAGRLFDAVSALLGICRESSFEGEAATDLQFAAERGLFEVALEKDRILPIIDIDGFAHLPTDSLFKTLVEGVLAHRPSDELAFEFHAALAAEIAEALKYASDKTGIRTIALSGGVFQNTLLLELLHTRLESEGFNVLVHSLVPPNDGGLCLGQAAFIKKE